MGEFFKSENLNKIRTMKYEDFRHIPKINIGDKDEIRLLVCDYCYSLDGQNMNDMVCSIIRLIPRTYGYERQLVYIERYTYKKLKIQAIRIRQLFDDFDCDYIVLDNLSLALYDNLCIDIDDLYRNKIYKGFSCINNKSLQERCNPDLEMRIWSIDCNSKSNSEYAISLKYKINEGKIRLLEDTLFKQNSHLWTDKLIDEIDSMTSIIDSKDAFKCKASIPNSGSVYCCLAYGNYVADVLENMNYNNKDMNDIIKMKYSEQNEDKIPNAYIYTNNEDMITLSLLGYKSKVIQSFINKNHDYEIKKDLAKEYFKIFNELQTLNGNLVISNIDFATRKIIMENTCKGKYLGFRVNFVYEFYKELKKYNK